MALVEAVARELEDQFEEVVGAVLGQALLDGTIDELGAFLLDLVVLLLADVLDQRVGVAQLDAAQAMHDLHDLFLIHHHAIRLARVRVDDVVDLGHVFGAVLAPVVIGDEVHRPGAEERVGRDEIFEPVGLHLDEQATHAARFKLEDASGLAPTEDFEDALVGVGEAVEV